MSQTLSLADDVTGALECCAEVQLAPLAEGQPTRQQTTSTNKLEAERGRRCQSIFVELLEKNLTNFLDL